MCSGCLTWVRVHKWTGKVESCLISFQYTEVKIWSCVPERGNEQILWHYWDALEALLIMFICWIHTHTHSDGLYWGQNYSKQLTMNSYYSVWYNYKNIKGPFWRFYHILAVWLQIKHRTLLLSIFQIIPRPVCVMKECRLKRDRISQLHWCDNTSLWVHVCVVINAKSKTESLSLYCGFSAAIVWLRQLE